MMKGPIVEIMQLLKNSQVRLPASQDYFLSAHSSEIEDITGLSCSGTYRELIR